MNAILILIYLGGIGVAKTQAVAKPLLTKIIKKFNAPEPTCVEKENKTCNLWNQNIKQKVGGLILDEKGEYIEFIKGLLLKNKRPLTDLIIVGPKNHKYNPLDPTSSAEDNANKLSQIHKIISGGGGGKYKFWDDTSKTTVKNFLTMLEVIKPKEKIGLDDLAKYIREDEMAEQLCDKVEDIINKQSKAGKIDYVSKTKYEDAVSSTRNEWVNNKSDNVKSTLKVTISQLLGDFAADPRLQKAFCKNSSFSFKQVINEGKIVILDTSITSSQITRYIGMSLKLDFQTWTKRRNGSSAKKFGLNTTRTCLFLSDGFQNFLTENDGKFFGVSRSTRVINITAAQSISSYHNVLKNEQAVKELQSNIATHIFLKTTDIKTAKLGVKCSKIANWKSDRLKNIEKKQAFKFHKLKNIFNIPKEDEFINIQVKISGKEIYHKSNTLYHYNSKCNKKRNAKYKVNHFINLNAAVKNKKDNSYYSEAIVYYYNDSELDKPIRIYKTKLKYNN